MIIVGKRLCLSLFPIPFLFILISAYASQNAEVFEKGKYVKKECISLSDIHDLNSSDKIKLSQFGGWMNKKVDPTGFFHTRKLDNRWWIMDPDGYAFLSFGINSVNLPNRKTDKPPTKQELDWGKKTLSELKNLGFNTLGCWSDDHIVRKLENPMPYCSSIRKINSKSYLLIK